MLAIRERKCWETYIFTIVDLEEQQPLSHRASQFAFARTRCRDCNLPARNAGYYMNIVLYTCLTCHPWRDRELYPGLKYHFIYSPKRHLLRWVFKLTYYAICLRRILCTPRRNMALLALHKVPEAGLREKIIRSAGLW